MTGTMTALASHKGCPARKLNTDRRLTNHYNDRVVVYINKKTKVRFLQHRKTNRQRNNEERITPNTHAP